MDQEKVRQTFSALYNDQLFCKPVEADSEVEEISAVGKEGKIGIDLHSRTDRVVMFEQDLPERIANLQSQIGSGRIENADGYLA